MAVNYPGVDEVVVERYDPTQPHAPVGGERVHEHPRAGDQVAEEDDLDHEDGEAQHRRVEVWLS